VGGKVGGWDWCGSVCANRNLNFCSASRS
jgi:hypothetical protein